MSTTLPSRSTPLTDLAAGLTDLGLEALRSAGAHGDSVAMELAVWRALSAELARELGVRHVSEPLGGLVEEVVHRAALRVASASVPDRAQHELEGAAEPRLSARQGARGPARPLWVRGLN